MSEDPHRLLEQYKNYLPIEFRKEFYDVIVIHPTESEADENNARAYVENLRTKLKPQLEDFKVALFDDFAPDVLSRLQTLEEAVKRSNFRFIFITKNYSNTEVQQKFFTESALTETINNFETRETVVPVCDHGLTETDLPIYLQTLCGLCLDDSRFHYNKVADLVREKIGDRKQKEADQKKKQLDWAVQEHQARLNMQ